MDKKYYLNNTSKESIQITLTKVRTIKPLSSIALNVKDVAIVKKLKADRKGKPSKLDALLLSTIKIENDCRYNEDAAKAAIKADKTAKAQAKKEEEKARKELEAQIKAQEEQKASEERKAIEELLKEEAAKEGKTFDEASLQKAVDAYIESMQNAVDAE